MAITQNTYTGNGSTVLYSFTFPYIDSADVKVTLNGTLTTAYTFANATTIQFTTAPTAGVAIRIYRETYNDEASATFFPGSSIKASDLNNNFTQTLYVVQEVVSRYISKLGDTMQGILNMGGFKITNLGAPTSGTDATTKTYVDTQDALKVSKTGDTMSGNLAMGGNKVTGLGSPSGSADAATKSYVDGYINTTYLGPLAFDPTTRPGGSPLQEGDLYFNTFQDILKAWTGTQWVISAAAGNIVRWRKTASAGNTTLSGVDDLGITLSYVVGNEQVYLNGSLQTRGVDYTAATGTSITFTPALLAGDVVELHAVQGYVSATITPGSINDALVAPAAGIQYSKLALSNSIVNADVNASAGIVATKLAFTQSGTGAAVRTVDSKLKDVVSVKDFGAVGDGVVDDTAAIQAAIDSTVSGIEVNLPAGLYRITDTIYLKRNSVKLIGAGGTSTRILFDKAAGGTAIAGATNSSTTIRYCELSGIFLTCLNSSGTNGFDKGIDITTFSFSTFDVFVEARKTDSSCIYGQGNNGASPYYNTISGVLNGSDPAGGQNYTQTGILFAPGTHTGANGSNANIIGPIRRASALKYFADIQAGDGNLFKSISAEAIHTAYVQLNSGSAVVTGTATSGTQNRLNDTTKAWTTNEFINDAVLITGGTGSGQSRIISANTSTQLTTRRPWGIQPDATSTYEIYKARVKGNKFEGVRGEGLSSTNPDFIRAEPGTDLVEFKNCYVHSLGTGIYVRDRSGSFRNSWYGDAKAVMVHSISNPGPNANINIYEKLSVNGGAVLGQDYVVEWLSVTTTTTSLSDTVTVRLDVGGTAPGNGDMTLTALIPNGSQFAFAQPSSTQKIIRDSVNKPVFINVQTGAAFSATADLVLTWCVTLT